MSERSDVEGSGAAADLSTVLPRLRNTLLRGESAVGHLWAGCDEHVRGLWCALAGLDPLVVKLQWDMPKPLRDRLSHTLGVMLSFLRRLAELPRG